MIKSRRLRLTGHVVTLEEDRSAFKILTGKPTRRRPLRRPRHKWEDNIRMDIKEIGVGCHPRPRNVDKFKNGQKKKTAFSQHSGIYQP